jgi:RNA polymerase sigma-70 factor (ECF subfamily)
MVTIPPGDGVPGPPDARFTGIFREHAPYVWRVLRRLGVAEADVEDVCQEVFLVVLRKLGEFEGRSSLRTWIYGICVRVASDHRRRAHQRRERVTDAPPELSFVPRQTSKIQRLQALAALDVALAALDDDKRAVFVLYEIEELSMADVAEAVGCPLQTAYSRLHAARRHVRAALASAAAGRGVAP